MHTHTHTCTHMHTHTHSQSGDLLQIEINTIAASLMGISERIFDMHR